MPFFVITFLLGLCLGAVILFIAAWIIWSKKSSHIAVLSERVSSFDALKNEVRQISEEKVSLLLKLEAIKSEKNQIEQFANSRIEELSKVHENMKQSFSLVSKEALLKSSDLLKNSFKDSLEQLLKTSERERNLSQENLSNIIKPLKESLSLVDKKVGELESNRQGAYQGLIEQIDHLSKSQLSLQKETHNLATALNAPVIRGRWGEMQLRRVVELSGLSVHCDFLEQESLKKEGDLFRPDMIVTLPKDKKIVIDAKVPLEIFGDDKLSAKSETLKTSLRRHLLGLKKKSYHKILGQSPEFVVMFLPGEAFLYGALSADRNLLDFAAQNEVIIATPITLVALLKAIAFGFKQESIANNIEEVRKLSQQLIDRVNKVTSHFDKLGKSLKNATDAYNNTLSSLDSRVLVTARKLAQIKSISEEESNMFDNNLTKIDALPKQVFSSKEDISC